jgi:hypothetical protein
MTTNNEQDGSMSEHVSDIRHYVEDVNEQAVTAIVDFCRVARHQSDTLLVSPTDPRDLETIRERFAGRRLGLTPQLTDNGIRAATQRMDAARHKRRVTFYYLMAEATGTLGRLA